MSKLVGITAHRLEVRDGAVEFGVAHEVVATAYVRAVARAGGVPVLLPIIEPDDGDALHALLDRFDAIVITGGADVDPTAYRAAVEAGCGPTQPDRDRIDLAVARACVERNQPTLAICRGVQVLNVALGGTLTQHIDDHMVVPQYNEKVHDIDVHAGSRLAEILETDTYWSNSLHHQCIAELGLSARAVALAPDGTIEAVEVVGAPRVLGVQWHPELLRHDAAHLRLFGALLDA
jgi:gamma-glutamyl-gamma-aminobutyrate hydrolase PuuD